MSRPQISSHLPENWCRALGWISVGGRRRPILPREVAPLLLVPVVLLTLVLLVLELRFAQLEGRGELTSLDWIAEDRLINEFNTAKIRQRGWERRWLSAGMQWPQGAEGRKRILVVGDSFAWGSGNLNANDVWWRQLARELQRRGYWQVDVVAICASGASTQDQLRWLRDEGWLEKVAPDIVLVGYVTNDPAIRDGDGFLVKQLGGDVPYPDWPGLDQTIGQVFPRVSNQLKARLNKKWETTADAFAYVQWELEILKEPNLSRYGEVLQDLGSFMRARKVPYAFFTLPNSPTPRYFEPRYEAVRPLFESAGIPFFDLLPRFVERFGEGGREIAWGVNPANGHPGPLSTLFYAGEVATWMERHHPAALGPKRATLPPLRPVINDWAPPEMRVASAGEYAWTLQLPNDRARAPRLPMNKSHGHVAFEQPVALRTVRLEADVEDAELYYSVVDSATQMEAAPVSAGKRTKGNLKWDLPQARVNTLRIAVRASQSDRDGFVPATLSMTFDDPAVRP